MSYIGHNFKIEILQISRLVLMEIWEKQNLHIQFNYMWALKKVQSTPITYLENQTAYPVTSTSTYFFLQQLTENSSCHEIVENPEGGIKFELIGSNQSLGFGILQSHELERIITDSGIYQTHQNVEIQKKKTLFLNLKGQTTKINTTPCKLEINFTYSAQVIDKDYLQRYPDVLTKHNKVAIQFLLPKKSFLNFEINLKDHQQRLKRTMAKRFVQLFWTNEELRENQKAKDIVFNPNEDCDDKNPFHVEYPITITEEVQQHFQEGKMIIQILLKEEALDFPQIVGRIEVPLTILLRFDAQDTLHKLTIVDRKGLFIGLIELKAYVSKYSTNSNTKQIQNNRAETQLQLFKLTNQQRRNIYFEKAQPSLKQKRQLDPSQVNWVASILRSRI